MSRLLYIRYKKSGKVLEGGEQVSQKNWTVLCSILGEKNVDTVFIHDENRRRTIADYLKGAFWFPFGYFFGLTPGKVRKLVETARDYDYVFIDRSVFGIIAKQLKKNGYKGLVIGFFHNVEVLYFKAKLGHKPWRFIITRCAHRNDRWTCRYADRIISLNARDADTISSLYGRMADALVPVTFNDTYKRESYPQELTSGKPLCLFLGSYFTPNCEGIEWFSKNVYPHVDVTMKIVGKGMSRLRENYYVPEEARIVSDAPDLVPYYEEADIMVLPIFKGSGMKVKTCESLMYGKNIIATSEALEGYELDYDMMGARCNTAQEFIDAIESFIRNPRPRFNGYCRSVFLEKYSTDSVVDTFKSILK